ncbi:hypothetical protein JTE90_001277 [Oedothorax gibbosus]|uniref:Mediator of RNA polymerase II transcription subunit 23 n=1 Tax=Oedothorax gibbosus TaxID=931172 RepID=A0AAV6V4Q2_9ARAC|nr:hypothetical protein JTE90_001277 [Oedothorax gibbosus]
MEPAILSVERKVARFVTEGVVLQDEIDGVLRDFYLYTEEEQLQKYREYKEEFVKLISTFSKEELVTALDHYVKLTSSQKPKTSKLLFAILNVTSDKMPPRAICDSLLKCPYLNFDNETFWCSSFLLINKAISSIDYKGARDVLKVILEKANDIKPTYNISYRNQFDRIEKVLETLLDRNECLLPSYLALDELQKKKLQTNKFPHWKFSRLISSFIESFTPTAQLVSISAFMVVKGDETMSKLLPVVGHSSTMGNVWKLDHDSGKPPLKGLLPYNEKMFEPQTDLLRYVLQQSYSRELVCNMLGFNKQQRKRCPLLEEQLVELLVAGMEKSETEADNMEDGGPTQLLWQHLSSQLIYFILFQYASFPHIVEILYTKLKEQNLQKGRDHLMWVLLQFISGSIQKNVLKDFLPFMKLYDLLYQEKEPLPVPDAKKSSSTHAFAAICIWMHLMRKAELDKKTLTRKLPVALTKQLEFLQTTVTDADLANTLHSDYHIPLLCNAYSTNHECFTKPMGHLVEAVYGNQKQPASAVVPTVPLSMPLLDSLTVHTKMSLIHNVVSHILSLAQNASKSATDAKTQQKLSQSSYGLSPALVETYSRLLVYSEIESLGIKSFITHLLPAVFRSSAWGILHTLLEMFSYRLHHFQHNYRVQLLSHLHSLAALTQTNQIQLHLCVESTVLRLIAGMGNSEVQPQFSRPPTEPKTLISNDSEELNKVLVLTMARAINITRSESLSGTWCRDILTAIMQQTPLSWSSLTLQYFPKVLQDFYTNHQVPNTSKEELKRSVEEGYRLWKTMSNENDKISYFSSQTSSLFLCILWKVLVDQDRISAIAYEILDRIGARGLSAHLRTFADFLVFEFSVSAVGQLVNQYIDALNDLIWKYHVIQLDRMVLCLALRSFEGNEAQVCFFIINMLLLKSQDFKNRVYDFVNNNSPQHWKQSDWHEKHLRFHQAYEEKFYFEGLRDLNTKNSNHTVLPVYFGNVCLRFLPVMDIVIHRFIELPTVDMLVKLIDNFGCLYKFHDHPLTYLYNTLHYYEKKLQGHLKLKKKLVSTVIGSLNDIRPEGWALSEDYLSYIKDVSDNPEDENSKWKPDSDYYVKLIGRLVDTLAGKGSFPHTDWRFNEFPNAGAHALHVTCIELMALPVPTETVGNNLLNVVLRSHSVTIYSNLVAWMNAVGLVLSALPETYWNVLNDRIVDTFKSPFLVNPSPDMDAFRMFDFAGSYNCANEYSCSHVIGLVHCAWYHASLGQICTLPQLMKEKFKPAVTTEEQFLFVCHLACPFLQRFCMDKTRCVMEITVELYEMLEIIDKNCEQLQYTDVICDLLYHIKYQFIGDAIKNEIEKSVRNLRPAIQRKLRFITHMNIEEIVEEMATS